MTGSNDKVQRIIDATSEVENDEELGRVVGEGLLQIARSGRSAWEALFEFLGSASADQVAEVIEFFNDWTSEQLKAGSDEE